MGAHGVAIFDDDVACDARAVMLHQLSAGLSIRAATDAVLEELADALNDVEDGPVVILALASAQCELGRVDERIKQQALGIIAGGVDFRWKDTEFAEQRRAVLVALGTRLSNVPGEA